jgi:hypothetical protein
VTAEELAKVIDDARRNGHSLVTLRIRRKCRGSRATIIPGVYGQVVQWGDGTWDFPSIVMVNVDDLASGVDHALRRAGG